MSELRELQGRLRQGGELSYDEYQRILAQQEQLDDLLEMMRGNANTAHADRLVPRSAGGFAIVVGHTQTSAGAYGGPPINQSEYPWNKDLASKIKTICAGLGVPAKIFYRDGIGISGAYQQVSAWGASCVVELHFNAFNGSARGTETLYDKDRHAGSAAWATRLQEAMLATLGTQDRGLKECDPGDRGYGSVSALNIPSALIEPFFGDNPVDAQKGHNNKDDLAEAIARTAAAQLGVA
ncbi:N-acetylmuramoyl-L-alanine amidase [Mesorhizobium sp. M0659]|uniref:N-acetylmuramoyl-L-alanine amidase n=1 Tax=Mesorhizobium sp. M0659 TaxID=2956980 RepID=UPI0033389A9C